MSGPTGRSAPPPQLLESPTRQAALRWLLEEAPGDVRPARDDEALLCAQAALGESGSSSSRLTPEEILSSAKVERRRYVLAFLAQGLMLDGRTLDEALAALKAHESIPGIRIGSAPHLVPTMDMDVLPWREELKLGNGFTRHLTAGLKDLCRERLSDPTLDGYDQERALRELLDRAAGACQWDQIVSLESQDAGASGAPLRLPAQVWLSFAHREFDDDWAAAALVQDIGPRILAESKREPSTQYLRGPSLQWMSPLVTELLEQGSAELAMDLADRLRPEEPDRSAQGPYSSLAQACAAAGAVDPIETLAGKATRDETRRLLEVYAAVARRDRSGVAQAAARCAAHPSWLGDGQFGLSELHTAHAALAVHARMPEVLAAVPPEPEQDWNQGMTADLRWHPAGLAALAFEEGARDATALAALDFNGLCDTLPIVFRRGPAAAQQRTEPFRWYLMKSLLHDLVSAHYAMPGAQPMIMEALDALYTSAAAGPIVDACRKVAQKHDRSTLAGAFSSAGRHAEALELILSSPDPEDRSRRFLHAIVHQLKDERSPA